MAHMLHQRAILEELRGFLNLEIPGSKLITFILFGLPELEENLDQSESGVVGVADDIDTLSG